MIEWQDGPVRVLIADVRQGLASLPDKSVHVVVTSPPYWGLRDYGAPGQLGLESTPDEYVCALVDVFREVRRVLRSDGCVWLNLGDSYAAQGGGKAPGLYEDIRSADATWEAARIAPVGLKPKDLIGIPWRVALTLQADGWWLRSDVIWSKPNPMPESITDRPTSAHEHVFLLTKAERYFYDADAVRESHTMTPQRRPNGRPTDLIPRPSNQPRQAWSTAIRSDTGVDGHPNGRNLRNVWTIATQPYPEAHFATFPEELARRCIAAGSSEHGCCPECGAPWLRRTERTAAGRVYERGACAADHRAIGSPQRTGAGSGALSVAVTTTGWEPTCAHDADPVPCTVLDPFAGSGTTLAVARRMGRQAIGIELQPTYLPLIKRQVIEASRPLFEAPQPAPEPADQLPLL